jgi:hypothetical protein
LVIPPLAVTKTLPPSFKHFLDCLLAGEHIAAFVFQFELAVAGVVVKPVVALNFPILFALRLTSSNSKAVPICSSARINDITRLPILVGWP